MRRWCRFYCFSLSINGTLVGLSRVVRRLGKGCKVDSFSLGISVRVVLGELILLLE